MNEFSVDDIVPPLSRASIEKIADGLFCDYVNVCAPNDFDRRGMNFEDFYERVLYPTFEFRFGLPGFVTPASGNGMLGEYRPLTNEILLYCAPDDPRFTFTRAHEVGHAILHGPMLRAFLKGRQRSVRLISNVSAISGSTASRSEIQANQFAAAIAAPMRLVSWAIRRVLAPTKPLVFLRSGPYCLTADGQSQSMWLETYSDLCVAVALRIRRFFDGLSVQALSYRVEISPWLRNLSSSDSTLSIAADIAEALDDRDEGPRLHRMAPAGRGRWGAARSHWQPGSRTEYVGSF